jgi:hypothetical protein
VTKALIGAAVLVAGAWYLFGDPRGWPQAIREERTRLPQQLKEALGAGKRAAARREQELDEELAAALGKPPGARA